MASDEPTRPATPPSAPSESRPRPEPDAGDRARSEQERQVRRARQSRVVKLVVVLGALIVLIIFVVANSDPVPVSYVFVEGKPRLIWVMLVCAVLGGIIGFAVGRPGKELRRTSKQDRQRGRDT